MNDSSLPVSIELSQFVVTHLNDVKPIFEYGQSDITRFQQGLNQPMSSLEHISDSDFPHLLPFIQLSMILGLTVFSETEKELYHATLKDKQVSIVWSKQNTTRFELGDYSRGFVLFSHQFLTHMLSEKASLAVSCFNVLSGVYRLLDIELTHLKRCSDQLLSILRSQDQLLSVFSQERDLDLFFIVLSSLPTDTLNALYLHIQQFFPESFHLKTKRGQDVDLKYFFQIPSVDISMLLEKIKVHFNLFFFSDSVDVGTTIQSETLSFLSKALNERVVLDQTMAHIQSVKDDQLGFRMTLYKLFTDRIHPFIYA